MGAWSERSEQSGFGQRVLLLPASDVDPGLTFAKDHMSDAKDDHKADAKEDGAASHGAGAPSKELINKWCTAGTRAAVGPAERRVCLIVLLALTQPGTVSWTYCAPKASPTT